MVMELKDCRVCRRTLEIVEFYRAKSGVYRPYCYECSNKKLVAWRKKNKKRAVRLTEKRRKELRVELEALQVEYDKVFNVMYLCFLEGKIGSKKHLDAVRREGLIHKECKRKRSDLGEKDQDICKNQSCSKCAYYMKGSESINGIGRFKDGCDYKRNVLHNDGIFAGFLRRHDADKIQRV